MLQKIWEIGASSWFYYKEIQLGNYRKLSNGKTPPAYRNIKEQSLNHYSIHSRSVWKERVSIVFATDINLLHP
jgi:hypothetical protein